MTTSPARALALAAVLTCALVLSACGGSTDALPSASPATSEASATPSASETATEDKDATADKKKDKKSSAPAPQPTQPSPQPSQPAERTVDCALAADAFGAYFPAFSGFASAMTSGDPGEVFSAARQFSDVLNGFQVALPGMSDNAMVFIALSKEATRIALTASESGDPAALAAAATEIEALLEGDEDRYTSGQEELQEYLDANCGVAP